MRSCGKVDRETIRVQAILSSTQQLNHKTLHEFFEKKVVVAHNLQRRRFGICGTPNLHRFTERKSPVA